MRPHLLIVDDDKDILALLTNFLGKHSYTVSIAEDGVAMFSAISAGNVDLVILDIMLRNEDGFSLCRRLRTSSNVPVIMLSAMAEHTDRVVGLEIGADDYLTKRSISVSFLPELKQFCGEHPASMRFHLRMKHVPPWHLGGGAWTSRAVNCDPKIMPCFSCQVANASFC